MKNIKAPKAISPAKWRSMGRVGKVLAVCRDVIYRVKNHQIIPEMGVWVKSDLDNYEGRDLQTSIKKGNNCTACAIGGAICGIAFFEDKIKMGNTEISEYNEVRLSQSIQGKISKIFGEENMRAMEAAFETASYRYDGGGGSGLGRGLARTNKDLYLRASRFGRRYKSDRNRMLAIYQNIIDHKGVFTP